MTTFIYTLFLMVTLNCWTNCIHAATKEWRTLGGTAWLIPTNTSWPPRKSCGACRARTRVPTVIWSGAIGEKRTNLALRDAIIADNVKCHPADWWSHHKTLQYCWCVQKRNTPYEARSCYPGGLVKSTPISPYKIVNRILRSWQRGGGKATLRSSWKRD